MRFVLGGSDTEMKHIESVVRQAGHLVIKASVKGTRVTRARAYNADHPSPQVGDVWVECQHKDYTKKEMHSLGVDIVDHHYEGDPGYGRPPAEYWSASSVGQVYSILSLERTELANMIAAGDHCLYAAYHNMCPDVDQKDFIAHRMAHFGKFSDPDKFSAEYNKVVTAFKRCGVIKLGSLEVRDLTPITERYHSWLADISCLLNIKYVTITPHRKKNGTVKYFVGNLSRKEIRYFTDELIPSIANEVISVYGDPLRQFAGAIISLSE